MNWNHIESGWNEFKVSARRQWRKLGNEELMGPREQLASRAPEAYPVNKEEAARQAAGWQSKPVEKQAPAAKS